MQEVHASTVIILSVSGYPTGRDPPLLQFFSLVMLVCIPNHFTGIKRMFCCDTEERCSGYRCRYTKQRTENAADIWVAGQTLSKSPSFSCPRRPYTTEDHTCYTWPVDSADRKRLLLEYPQSITTTIVEAFFLPTEGIGNPTNK